MNLVRSHILISAMGVAHLKCRGNNAKSNQFDVMFVFDRILCLSLNTNLNQDKRSLDNHKTNEQETCHSGKTNCVGFVYTRHANVVQRHLFIHLVVTKTLAGVRLMKAKTIIVARTKRWNEYGMRLVDLGQRLKHIRVCDS